MRPALLVAAAFFTFGCGRTEVVRYTLPPPDASIDAGRPDAGRPDAGPPDAGPPDAGPPDAGPCMPRPLPLVLPPLDQQIAMGALMFPLPTQQCSSPSNVDLSPAQGNASRLLGLFTSSTPLGGTPTSEALDVAAAHLRTLHTATSARALILATDGAPNCNEALMNSTCVCTMTPQFNPNCDDPTHCLDDTRTVQSLRTLFSQSLPTYVIGLGSQLNLFASTLDQMAVAGGVPRMGIGARYYSVGNQAELTDAFGRITAQLTKCTFLLNGLGANDTFAVSVDGVEVPEGPTGWEWLNQVNGELALHGMACDRAAGGATATVLVDCH